jgi:CMP/dCMP kinase
VTISRCAAPQERAKRRVAQLRSRGEMVDPSEILNEIVSRDHRDASRAVGPLAVPTDAIVMDTTHLSQGDVIDQIVARVQSGRTE